MRATAAISAHAGDSGTQARRDSKARTFHYLELLHRAGILGEVPANDGDPSGSAPAARAQGLERFHQLGLARSSSA